MKDEGERAERIELGRPGASAQAEFERRLHQDAARRRRRFGRVLGPVVAALAGVRPSTVRWRTGGRAEERVGRLLRDAVADAGVVLHDRAVPHSRANIDHLAVVASGVWVVDTKRYRGLVRRARPAGRLLARRTLLVNGRDRGHLLPAALRQRALVEAAAGPDVTVRAVLCFAGAEWGFLARPFELRGVLVTWPAALASSLTAAGPIDDAGRSDVAARLARAFPPYAPSGTSRHHIVR